MMANLPADSLVELEDAVATCPPERCTRILEGITHLLTTNRDYPQQMLVGVVDGVLLRLTERVAVNALMRLSRALAELNVAPQGTLLRLALHEDPDVACPLLLESQALSAPDLVAIASSRGERQQRAICDRDSIPPDVTEALIRHGGRPVYPALLKNPGTKFSDAAYAALIAGAGQDDEIIKALALRPDTPDLIVRKLLSARAGKTLPDKTPPAKPDASAVPPTHDAASGPTTPALPCPAAYANARPEIVALARVGKLNDSTVNRFAIRGETANLVSALSVLSGAPIEIIEHVMTDENCEGLVMACRASRLNWATTLAILSNRSGVGLSFAQRERAQLIFETLLLSTSQWTVRWGEIAAGAGSSDPGHRSTKAGVSR
ncbi:uncharacterized protein DUF2336 [Bradyrhizobium huanghuaihaiense]|uniref:Uncharacterized protein DUF2336 n=1 Tax=Bradyrhizobium huanghuaihaiense TaxID=990078 RepID=A0A562RG24_9BRAD|nr:DUF2336 domain-containing protein [Bradyrhizobium huanghuaihaiense]TWI68017.1 uncharacterized protein DUF2336 [Bradyrhizobium huanghuaihaiense]